MDEHTVRTCLPTDKQQSNLFNQDCLKDDQHGKSEDAVLPVLFQAPQSHTEHLEHKEGCCGPLLEQGYEVRGFNVQSNREQHQTKGHTR